MKPTRWKTKNRGKLIFKVAAGIKPVIMRTRTKNTEKVKKAAHEAEKASQSAKRAYERYWGSISSRKRQKDRS